MDAEIKDKRTSRDRVEYVARRIADVSSADWKKTPKERQKEFLKAARRAVSGVRSYESYSAKRQEAAKKHAVKRQERLKARKVAAEAKSEEKAEEK